MIVQPVKTVTVAQFKEDFKRAFLKLDQEGYSVHTLTTFKDFYEFEQSSDYFLRHLKTPALFRLADRVCLMAFVDAVYFAKGWEQDLSCIVEHELAVTYDIQLIYESQ